MNETPPPPVPLSSRASAAARYAGGVLALAATYYVSAQLALNYGGAAEITFFWPATGVAIAVLFRAGLRYWPGLVLGALICARVYTPVMAVVLSVMVSVGPILTVVLLRRYRFDPSDLGRKGLTTFLLAGLIGVTVTSTTGTVWRVAVNLPAERLAEVWLIWWVARATGFLVVAPALLTAARPRSLRAAARPVPLLAVTTAVSALAFTDLAPYHDRALLLFPPFLMLIWVGMHERLPVGSLHIFTVAGFAVMGSGAGVGAFGQLDPMPKMLMVWGACTLAALIVLALTTTLAEREKAEAALTAAARDYQNLVDCTPAAIVRYTPDGTLTFVNETLCRLLEQPREALLGQSILDFIPDMPRSERVADLPLAQALSAPPAGVSGMIRKFDGSCLWYRWTARLVRTADGREEFQAVGIDLTERRRADAERAALERKMQDTQRLEALGVLAGGVAHDFNNLLAGVLGHAELAVGSLPDGHPARDHLATVLSGVAQAGGLTRQLLAYSGKGRFLLKPIDLNDLIKQTTELLRLTLPKKVGLALDLTPGLPAVTGDDGQIRQVLMNLLINAGEAIGDRTGSVTVTTAVHDLTLEAVSGGVYSPAAPGQFVELIVSDTGCGMDDATKARLFDPFFTTKFTGRGLGMSAVLGIVRGHGGGIRVDSRVGIGTRFTVLLPATAEPIPGTIHTPAASGALVETPLGTARHTRSAPAPGATVTPAPAAPGEARGLALVADDEPTVRRVAELLLRQMGYEVLTATNGEEAVELFATHAERVRVVILDLMMPVMDGAEALAAIRDRSPVPVILCSGYTSEAVPEELAADTATGFLQKPYARGDLQVALTAIGV